MTIQRVIDGRTLTAECAEILAPLALDALRAVEQTHAGGAPLAGLRMRFGWSVLTVREQPDGTLVLCEPDFDHDPMRNTRSTIDATLAVLARQSAFMRKVKVTPEEVYFEQMIVVARGALGSPAVRLTRSASEARDDSGWYITAADETQPSDDPDAYTAIRVYELLQVRPALLAVLALPAEFTVAFERDEIRAVYDGNGNDRWSGAS